MAKIGVQAMDAQDGIRAAGGYATLKRLDDLGFHAVELSQIPMTPDNDAVPGDGLPAGAAQLLHRGRSDVKADDDLRPGTHVYGWMTLA
jgi:hypothetical protein